MNPEKDVLREIFRPRRILHGARNQREHQPLVRVDQFLKGAFVARTAALHELALVDGGHAPKY